MASPNDDEIIASCTPDTLCSLATSKVARLILGSAVPASLRWCAPHFSFQDCVDMSQPFPCSCHGDVVGRDVRHCGDVGGDNMDDVILAEEGHAPEDLLEAKGVLMDTLRRLAEWWRRERWFGTFDSLMRDRMRKACYYQLQMHQHNQSPLLLLTLELLLCHEAGYSLMARVMNPIDRQFCSSYCNFLSELQPFGISRLYATRPKFELGFVTSVICSFSPLLTFLYIGPEFVIEDSLGEIGRALPRLETFIVPVKQYEVRDSVVSGIRLSTDGGVEFERQLYPTFFGGLQKCDVKQKVEAGEMDSVPVSFQRLRNVDIGSHRHVLEFLHYLLHIYPNLESICCDQEGWRFSKYSLNFLVVTPTTLGYGPAAFQGSRLPLHLQSMSFSSMCLTQQLPLIMERYKNLKHISLHLVRGPRKIPDISQLAQELVEGQKECHCLTINVSVYLSREELIHLYRLPVHSLSSSLTILQFHLTNEVSGGAIREIINWCPFLRELAVLSARERCEVAEPESFEEETTLNELSNLTALGVYSEFHVSPELYLLTLEILEVAPNLTVLDVTLGGNQFSERILHAAMCGMSTGIEVLRLHLVPRGPNLTEARFDESYIDTLIQPLVSRSPRLCKLVVSGMCEYVLQTLRLVYWGSRLQIVRGDTPLVAFRMLASRSC